MGLRISDFITSPPAIEYEAKKGESAYEGVRFGTTNPSWGFKHAQRNDFEAGLWTDSASSEAFGYLW